MSENKDKTFLDEDIYSSLDESSSDEEENKLKIISLNVCSTITKGQFPNITDINEYNKLRGLKIKEQITKYNPDIILLQEYSRDYCYLKKYLIDYNNTLDHKTNNISPCSSIFYKKSL